jgi:RNA:NAD 2'-phosphotransferase (TPT1/KptA family)
MAGLMYSDGYKFYLSVNGVWLTEHVPSEYLVKIEYQVNIDLTYIKYPLYEAMTDESK